MGLKISIRVDVVFHSSPFPGGTKIFRVIPGSQVIPGQVLIFLRSSSCDTLSGMRNAPEERNVRECCLGGV